MNHKRFRRFTDRDAGCVHCGELEAVAPHHRRNRGMGGSKELDQPANIVVLCSVVNGLLESDAAWAERAREYGWKLRAGQLPEETPVWYPIRGAWFLLDDEFGKKRVGASEQPAF